MADMACCETWSSTTHQESGPNKNIAIHEKNDITESHFSTIVTIQQYDESSGMLDGRNPSPVGNY
jgi:hypothetical protein